MTGVEVFGFFEEIRGFLKPSGLNSTRILIRNQSPFGKLINIGE